MAPKVTIHDFTFRHWRGNPPALSNINLAIPAGSVCALLGPTNAGKTTLLSAIAGILGSHHPHADVSGTITIGE
ncbi:MAG TPA: ATP-binding cassette domain-containing protein, partial [Bacteroidota bacterium]|nr:ATP-binding cassette domain-containing protein [Bacteroidota bacterium]